jgi:hypothetical protein
MRPFQIQAIEALNKVFESQNNDQRLKESQLKAIEELTDQFESRNKDQRIFNLHAPAGCGKTYVSIVSSLIFRNVLVIAPNIDVAHQWQQIYQLLGCVVFAYYGSSETKDTTIRRSRDESRWIIITTHQLFFQSINAETMKMWLSYEFICPLSGLPIHEGHMLTLEKCGHRFDREAFRKWGRDTCPECHSKIDAECLEELLYVQNLLVIVDERQLIKRKPDMDLWTQRANVLHVSASRASLPDGPCVAFRVDRALELLRSTKHVSISKEYVDKLRGYMALLQKDRIRMEKLVSESPCGNTTISLLKKGTNAVYGAYMLSYVSPDILDGIVETIQNESSHKFIVVLPELSNRMTIRRLVSDTISTTKKVIDYFIHKFKKNVYIQRSLGEWRRKRCTETDEKCILLLFAKDGDLETICGLNLQESDIVISYPLLSSEDEDQVVGRIDRLGQLKRKLQYVKVQYEPDVDLNVQFGERLVHSILHSDTKDRRRTRDTLDSIERFCHLLTEYSVHEPSQKRQRV